MRNFSRIGAGTVGKVGGGGMAVPTHGLDELTLLKTRLDSGRHGSTHWNNVVFPPCIRLA